MKYVLRPATASKHQHVCNDACRSGYHPCEWSGCTYAAKRSGDSNRHVNDVHLEIREFGCPWPDCGKTFSQPGNCNNHIKRHTGELHVCEVCGDVFTDPSARTRHRREQHSIVRGKYYALLSKEERMRGRKIPSMDKAPRSARGVEAAQPKSKAKGKKSTASEIALPYLPALSPSPAPSLESSSSSSSSVSDVDTGANALTADDWAYITSLSSLPTLDTSFDAPALNASLDISMFNGDCTLPSFDCTPPDFDPTMFAPSPDFDPTMFTPSPAFDSTMFTPSPSFDPTMFAPLDCTAFPPDTFVAPMSIDTEAWMPTSTFQLPPTPRPFYNY